MSRNLGPVEITEIVLAHAKLPKVCPYSRSRADGTRWTLSGRLHQANMWRRYAACWDGIPWDHGYVGWPHGHRVIIGRAWVEKILCHSKADCIRRARANLYLARRIRRDRRRMASTITPNKA